MITFCNQNLFIKDALDSCINQKVNFKYEILIGLDNGDAESKKIIQKYIEKYSNIKLFEINNSNLDITEIEKASINRLNLLKRANGEYISFLDGDDFYINENRHQIMIDFLDNNSNYIAAFHDYVEFDNNSKKHKETSLIIKNAQEFRAKEYVEIHKQFSCFVYRNIFKNSKFSDFNLDIVNDSTFTYYFLRYGNFYFIPRKMFAYRIGIKSIFFNKNEIIQNLYGLLCAEINQNLLPQYEKELCKKYKHLLNNICKKKAIIKKIEKNELRKIANFAKKQNCYFTYNLINYSKINILQKIKFKIYKNIFIKFKKNININKNIKKLSYFNTSSNFGDQLNLYILQRLFGLNIKHSHFKNANLIAIGSVLEQATSCKQIFKFKQVKIWGTGFIDEKFFKKEYFKKNTNILALRGKYTKNRVEEIFNKKINCPLGDPGLLASELLETIPEKKYKVGIVLHYVDRNSSFIKNIRLKDYKLIDITKNPIHILNEIAQCEVILSSAMHGLIAADSLNIPNQWIKLNNLLYGGDYKFKDYYSVFEHKPKAINLENEIITSNTIEKIKKNYQNLNFKIKIDKIKEALFQSGKKL